MVNIRNQHFCAPEILIDQHVRPQNAEWQTLLRTLIGPIKITETLTNQHFTVAEQLIGIAYVDGC